MYLSHCSNFTQSINVPRECTNYKVKQFLRALYKFLNYLSATPVLQYLVAVLIAIVVYRIFTIFLGLVRQSRRPIRESL